jgi:hypothetical protein
VGLTAPNADSLLRARYVCTNKIGIAAGIMPIFISQV